MGIRIRKVMGYGVTDLAVGEQKRPADPRWDYAAYQKRVEEEPTLREFLDWVIANEERLTSLFRADYGPKQPLSPGHLQLIGPLQDLLEADPRRYLGGITHDWESGRPDVLVFTPPEVCDRWHRYNDDIDHYESLGPPAVRTLRHRGGGLCYYHSRLKRTRPPSAGVAQALAALGAHGERALSGYMEEGYYNTLAGAWSDPADPMPGHAKDPAVLAHLRNDWRPTLPFSAIALIEFWGCFPNAYSSDGIAGSMWPMIYSYWC